MTLPSLLRPSFWFSLTPPPLLPRIDLSLLVVFSLLTVAGLMIRLFLLRAGWDKWTKRMMVKASTRLLVLGCTGLLLYFFSYERVYALSMRFGYALWAALFAGCAWTMYRYVMIEVPEIRAREAERERLAKWLPKQKA